MFGKPDIVAAGTNPRLLAKGDVDADGDDDLVIGHSRGTLLTLANQLVEAGSD